MTLLCIIPGSLAFSSPVAGSKQTTRSCQMIPAFVLNYWELVLDQAPANKLS